MDEIRFRYRPGCSVVGCHRPATHKVAATWSNGTSHELKHYGLTCEDHCSTILARARVSRDRLALAEGETVGVVQVFRLVPGHRDASLRPVDGT